MNSIHPTEILIPAVDLPFFQTELLNNWTISGNVDTNFIGDPSADWSNHYDNTSNFDSGNQKFNITKDGIYNVCVNWGKTSLGTRLSIRVEHYDSNGNGLFEYIPEFQDGYYGTANILVKNCGVGDYLKVRIQYQAASGTIVLLGHQGSTAHGDNFTRVNNMMTISYVNNQYVKSSMIKRFDYYT